ncbi:hypothetical protein HY642_02950 [Candidatus Woesearchaeota archaeon]|nr:hypothetical protein [Candidatus Woesearchaeota archaeon]
MMLVRYSEIGLKGQNRGFFEKCLVANITRKLGSVRAHRTSGRIIVDANAGLRTVFGISSYSIAEKFTTLQEATEYILEKTKMWQKKDKFRVSCQRLDKTFPLKSQDIEKQVGAAVYSLGYAVDLEQFDHEVGIEIIDGKAYVFFDRINGPGGLPVGCEGTVSCDTSTKHGELAALLMMKRGCDIAGKPTLLLQEYGMYKCSNPLAGVEPLFLDEIPAGSPAQESQRTQNPTKTQISTLTTHNPLTTFYPLIGMTREEAAHLYDEFKLRAV